MMRDGDVSARDSADEVTLSVSANLAGQVAIGELLKAQSLVPGRSRIARAFGVSPLNSETYQLYRGVVGEIEVGESLDRLGSDWRVLHAVSVDGGGDIDHIAIGPGGVFIIATKNHTGYDIWASQRTFMVAGIRYPYVRNMEHEMGRAERVISTALGRTIEVTGILAIVAPKSLTVRQRHRDVAVLHSAHLVPWLVRRRRVLSHDDVVEIGAVAALSSTWDQETTAVEGPEDQRELFEALRLEVHNARRVQLLWAIGASAIAVSAFVGITWSILMSALGTFGI
jgi:hypothetical protein